MGPPGLFARELPFLVVIHAEDPDQVLRNVDRALAAGADGVFLINHTISDAALSSCYFAARRRFKSAWLGLSYMRLSAPAALAILPMDASGLWVSDAGVEETGPQPESVTSFATLRRAAGWSGLYFGGVAFKHQRPVRDAALAASAAAPHVDVITTSGSASGSAAPLSKLSGMRHAIGHHPLALASGVSATNVGTYRPFIDFVLAASSVSDSQTELSPSKLAELVAAVG